MNTTRDLILDAVESLFGVLGYSKTTVDDVAKAAGVGKRTVYVYFPNKEELFLSTIDRIVERLVGRLRALAGEARPAAGRLRDMIRERVLYRFDSVRGYSHGLDELFASLRPAYLARRSAYFEAEAAVFTAVLAGGHASGELDVPDADLAAETVLLATNALLPYALSARELGRRKDVAARAERIADVLLNGLCRRTAKRRRAVGTKRG